MRRRIPKRMASWGMQLSHWLVYKDRDPVRVYGGVKDFPTIYESNTGLTGDIEVPVDAPVFMAGEWRRTRGGYEICNGEWLISPNGDVWEVYFPHPENKKDDPVVIIKQTGDKAFVFLPECSESILCPWNIHEDAWKEKTIPVPVEGEFTFKYVKAQSVRGADFFQFLNQDNPYRKFGRCNFPLLRFHEDYVKDGIPNPQEVYWVDPTYHKPTLTSFIDAYGERRFPDWLKKEQDGIYSYIREAPYKTYIYLTPSLRWETKEAHLITPMEEVVPLAEVEAGLKLFKGILEINTTGIKMPEGLMEESVKDIKRHIHLLQSHPELLYTGGQLMTDISSFDIDIFREILPSAPKHSIFEIDNRSILNVKTTVNKIKKMRGYCSSIYDYFPSDFPKDKIMPLKDILGAVKNRDGNFEEFIKWVSKPKNAHKIEVEEEIKLKEPKVTVVE